MFRTMAPFLFVLLSLSILGNPAQAGFRAPPIPARIGGTITVDGVRLTQAVAGTGYAITVTRPDGTDFLDLNGVAAEDRDGLSSSDWYLINVPLYDATDQPNGANPGDEAIIHVYWNRTELIVTSPEDGKFVVGQSGSNTQIDLGLEEEKQAAISGRLKGMGGNPALGAGDYDLSLLPVTVVNDGVTKFVMGGGHSLFIKKNGALWGAGQNVYGQLGVGNNQDQLTPVLIESEGVCLAAAGTSHSLFIKTDGSLWAMGSNSDGQLGDGTKEDRWSPVQIVDSGVIAVSAGDKHTLFIKIDGSLWAMGRNSDGQLGGGEQGEDQVSPIQIEGDGVVMVEAGGGDHSLYIKSDDSLWGMGDNNDGQLGIDNEIDQEVPIQILSSGVETVVAGEEHTLFIKKDGSLWCMGNNVHGQLGDGTTTDSLSPMEIESEGVACAAAGHDHSLYIKSDGSLWAMGYNIAGQLGNGTTDDRNTPIMVVPSGVLSADGGGNNSLFLTQTGSSSASAVLLLLVN